MTEKSSFHLNKKVRPAKETEQIIIADKSTIEVSRPNSSRKNQ